MGFLFCGKATAVATIPRTVAKCRLSNPTLQRSIPKNNRHPIGGVCYFWRREWDSNPRRYYPRRFSRPVPSTTRPSLRIALGQKRCPKAGFLITIRIILHRYYAKLLISSSPALRCRPDTYAGPRERQRYRRRAGSALPVRAGCGW